jgi:hypothetical protein
MRPFVSSSVALAAVSLSGVALAGVSLPASQAGEAEVRTSAARAHASTPQPRTTPLQVRTPPAGSTLAQEEALPPEPRAFFFTRAIYSGYGRGFGGGWGRGRSWAIDFPKADRQFLVVLKRLTNLDAFGSENAVRLDDPALRRYPFLYALEVGRMNLTQEEVRGLRDYLNAGGFLVIDDFWGPREWANFEGEMARVLPGRPIVDVPPDHAIFRSFYDIDEILQVPNVGNGTRGGPTAECYGCEPAVRGIFDDDGRLMVVINWNTDLGDAWEWAENPYYPLRYSTFAYQMGVNMIIYAMSH